MKGIDGYPQPILLALCIVTGIALVFAASTSTVAFGTYNPSWDGAAELREIAETTGAEPKIVRNTSQYTNVPSNNTLAVILSPETTYGSSDIDRVRAFVRNGGTLLVAGDFGSHTNALLAGVGATARIDGALLRDERYNYRSPALPVARNVSEHPLTRGVEHLTLNYGTAVQPGNATVLVSTSPYAYRDINRNGNLDTGESLDTWPVATVEEAGKGRIIVVGDPSMFINTMLDRSGNRAFVRTIFSGHERVLLDYSHAGQLPPLSVALLVLRDTPLFQFLFGMLGIAVIGLWARRPGLIARLRNVIETDENWFTADSDELAAYIRQRHPDWDDERIQRVIQAIMMRREEYENNE